MKRSSRSRPAFAAASVILPVKGLTPENQSVWDNYLAQNPKNGYLKVQTTLANGLIPVPNAKVIVEKTIDNNTFVMAEQLTDSSGRTEVLTLPAPDKTASLSPAGVNPYSFYKVRVIHPDYKSVTDSNIPVFDGITSIQPVGLLPKGSLSSELYPTEVTEEEPNL